MISENMRCHNNTLHAVDHNDHRDFCPANCPYSHGGISTSHLRTQNNDTCAPFMRKGRKKSLKKMKICVGTNRKEMYIFQK